MIYFVQVENDGPIKIGFAADIHKRISELQIANPYELSLIGCMRGDKEKEKRLHKKFVKYWIRGEWFKPGKKLLKYIYTYGNASPDNTDVIRNRMTRMSFFIPEYMEDNIRRVSESTNRSMGQVVRETNDYCLSRMRDPDFVRHLFGDVCNDRQAKDIAACIAKRRT